MTSLIDGSTAAIEVTECVPEDIELWLGTGCELDAVAAHLAMSGRTLKRRLAEHGTSFRQQVDAVRRHGAIRLRRSRVASDGGRTDR